ncbi:40S ribosomal protein S29-like [Elephas maximus indicus]|uniref:40S ribosomal protein S29-like n=1 Tax=Elephas maximus indicus TaxID=99487 RepID=UPI002116E316|nr:40S ribosomal protein S29-like [Elephas maximus indicus]
MAVAKAIPRVPDLTLLLAAFLRSPHPGPQLARAIHNGGHQQLYRSHLRQLCQGSRYCCVCSNQHSPIGKYSLNMCQECSHQYTNDIVFIKWD